MKTKTYTTIAFIMIFNLVVSQTIDSSYGTNGRVVSELSPGVDALNAMALQTDGKIVGLGFANNKLTLVRYQTNGTLDTLFGHQGIVLTNFTSNFFSPYDIVLQTDGKIIILAANSSTMMLARYTTNGILDTSFGVNGIADINEILTSGPYCSSMELLPDGKIIVTGSISFHTIFIIKYNSNRDLDTTFGTNGYTTTSLPTDSYIISSEDLCIQTDGNILLAVSLTNTSGYEDFSIFKYTSNGILDTDFGNEGFVKTDIGGIMVTDTPSTIKLQPNGKILLSGTSNLSFVVVRYNSDGSLDTTFNSTGIATTNVGGAYRMCSHMLIEPDGKIILAGYIGDDFGSTRYNLDGSIDPSYGNNGIYKIDFGTSYDYSNSIIRQSDGKFVMGGWTSFFCSNRAFGLIRFSSNALKLEDYNRDNSLKVYPNPTNSIINIQSDFTINTIELYDIQGRILSTSLENSNDVNFDISKRQNGLYFLKIKTEKGIKVVKIVKE
jgi:uncharacterized delta-60 repeat protein